MTEHRQDDEAVDVVLPETATPDHELVDADDREVPLDDPALHDAPLDDEDRDPDEDEQVAED